MAAHRGNVAQSLVVGLGALLRAVLPLYLPFHHTSEQTHLLQGEEITLWLEESQPHIDRS